MARCVYPLSRPSSAASSSSASLVVVLVVGRFVVVFAVVGVVGLGVLAFAGPQRLVVSLVGDARVGLGDRLGEVAEDVRRVVVRGRSRPGLVMSGQPPSPSGHDAPAEPTDAERQLLVLVVDDRQRPDVAEQARRRVLELLDEPGLGRAGCGPGSRAPARTARRAAPPSSRDLGDLRLAGGPLVGGGGVGIGAGASGHHPGLRPRASSASSAVRRPPPTPASPASASAKAWRMSAGL